MPDLSFIREEILAAFEMRRDKEGPIGCYRWKMGDRTNLYSSLDIAISYPIMGINAESLPENYKNAWVEHINSYADDIAADGRYKDIIPRHSVSHCNGMVIGALGYLSGKQVFPSKLYDHINTPGKIKLYLENIDWPRQWGSCGLWGTAIFYSKSSKCNKEWLDTIIGWLDENLDESTGMWRKYTASADKFQALGGFVHIYPVYELNNRKFPYPDQVINSIYNLQSPEGMWFPQDSFSYMDMDALYGYAAMLKQSDNKLKDKIKESVLKYSKFLMKIYNENKEDIFKNMSTHKLLCLVSTFGLLNQLLPEEFYDSVGWSDIFSDKRLYQTDKAEVFLEKETDL